MAFKILARRFSRRRGGDFYPGDLLCSMLSLPHEFWTANPELRKRVEAVARRAIDLAMGEHANGEIPVKAIRKAYSQFLGNG